VGEVLFATCIIYYQCSSRIGYKKGNKYTSGVTVDVSAHGSLLLLKVQSGYP